MPYFENCEYSCFWADIYIYLQGIFQKRKETRTETVIIMAILKFGLLLTVSDFIHHHKINNSTVPNKKVRLGKNPEIDKRTAYDYLDP